MPEKYVRMYAPDRVPLRENTLVDGSRAHDRWWFKVYTSADFFWRWHRKEPDTGEEWLSDDFALGDLTALYYGATSCVDDMVGDLMSALTERGLAENTLVVFVADHGDNLGSHGLFNKNSLIEESIRVPMIFHWPRLLTPQENQTQIAAMVDVMPTVLDLLDLEIPDSVQGQSLAPVLRGERRTLERNAAFVETGKMVGVRTLDWLYGLQYDTESLATRDEGAWLYDLGEDPLELSNLAGKPEHQGTEENLGARLQDWDHTTPYL